MATFFYINYFFYRFIFAEIVWKRQWNHDEGDHEKDASGNDAGGFRNLDSLGLLAHVDAEDVGLDEGVSELGQDVPGQNHGQEGDAKQIVQTDPQHFAQWRGQIIYPVWNWIKDKVASDTFKEHVDNIVLKIIM